MRSPRRRFIGFGVGALHWKAQMAAPNVAAKTIDL